MVDIEDGERHTIKEGLQALWERGTSNMAIHLCVDNQTALHSLSEGPSGGRDYVWQCLE